jgi:hypothetical protein
MLYLTDDDLAEYQPSPDNRHCPHCGDDYPEDEGSIVGTTHIEFQYAVALEYGGNPLSWTELIECLKCGKRYTLDNSNY